MKPSTPVIGPNSTGGEVIARYVDLALGTFGAIHPTIQDRTDLAEHLGLAAARWINERYGMGLPDTSPALREIEVAREENT